jgi:methionine synthase II (cobalamin-independent)
VTADRPWPAGAATGLGSLPGTDILEAVKLTLGELPDLPYLPELPARGPGADLVGRGAGLLVDLPVELYAARWRMAGRPGRDARVIRDLLERDLDALTDQAAELDGAIKIQAAGPWTLAAGIELPVGGVVLRDPGAVRDLVSSLAEGLRGYVAQVSSRLPRARVLLQLDEPSLPAVLAGRVPSESGFGALRAVPTETVRAAVAALVAAVEVPVVVHCCAADVPVGLLHAAGVRAVALDLGLVGDLDALGGPLDAGLGLFAGAVDTRAPSAPVPASADVAARVRDLWHRLGFPAARLPEQVVVTPACGLAGWSADGARSVLAACRDAARRLLDEGMSA